MAGSHGEAFPAVLPRGILQSGRHKSKESSQRVARVMVMVFKRHGGRKGYLVVGPIPSEEAVRKVERFLERGPLVEEDWDFVAYTYKLGDGHHILIVHESFPQGEFERLTEVIEDGQPYPLNFPSRYRVAHDQVLCRRAGCWHAAEPVKNQLEAIRSEYGEVIEEELPRWAGDPSLQADADALGFLPWTGRAQ